MLKVELQVDMVAGVGEEEVEDADPDEMTLTGCVQSWSWCDCYWFDCCEWSKMAHIPGLIETLVEMSISENYTPCDNDNATRAIIHLTNETENTTKTNWL